MPNKLTTLYPSSNFPRLPSIVPTESPLSCIMVVSTALTLKWCDDYSTPNNSIYSSPQFKRSVKETNLSVIVWANESELRMYLWRIVLNKLWPLEFGQYFDNSSKQHNSTRIIATTQRRSGQYLDPHNHCGRLWAGRILAMVIIL